MGHSARRAYNYHHHTQLGPIRPCQKKKFGISIFLCIISKFYSILKVEKRILSMEKCLPFLSRPKMKIFFFVTLPWKMG